MTREEAIIALKEEELKLSTCADVVSKQAVDDLIDELARAISDERCHISRGRSTGEIMSDILHLPPVSQQKEGQWVDDVYDGYSASYCSNCNSYGYHKWRYCPSCGAKMEDNADEENDKR